jgi:hypothetical protein
MRRSRPSVLAMLVCLASASLFASASCSDDLPAAEPVTHDAGTDGSALSDGAPPPDGHAGSGTAGSGAGGRGGASSGGATDAQVGMPSGGAASGGRGSATGGTGGAMGTCDPGASQDGAAPEPLSLCDRLQGAPALSFDFTRA